jgi:hypothetical protein
MQDSEELVNLNKVIQTLLPLVQNDPDAFNVIDMAKLTSPLIWIILFLLEGSVIGSVVLPTGGLIAYVSLEPVSKPRWQSYEVYRPLFGTM